VWFAFLHLDVLLRRADAVRQVVERSGGVVDLTEDFQQAGTGIEAVVEAVPAFLAVAAVVEEHVAAHLAGQCRAGFPDLGFDQRMAGFPDHRLAAARLNPGRQMAGGFDVVNDGGGRVLLQHFCGEQQQLAIRVDDVAVLSDHTEAVAVAVKGQADFGVAVLQCGNQVREVFRHRRVWMMVGEMAIDFAEQFLDFAADSFVKFLRIGASDPVAAIDGDLHRPL
jgi:hypothetical protein